VRINQSIRARQIRVIDADGKQVGIMSLDDAVALAKRQGLDLVEVAPDGNPPVCRIMDYGKYRFEQTKREKEAKKKQHTIKVKEVKFRPNIDDHDYQVKLRHAIDFLQKGFKVKLQVFFRGREFVHPEIGKKLLDRVIGDVAEYGAVESSPKQLGRSISLTIGPVKSH